jgi:glycosyltransferase involved in cell wall biosynthesis
MIGIAITFYNRPAYVSRMLNYIKHTNLENLNVIFCLIDDGSEDEQTTQMVRDFYMPNVPIIKIMKDTNTGVFDSLKTAWDTLENYGCSYLCNLDSDTIMKAKWLQEILKIYHKTDGDRIITGYNSYCHKLTEKFNDYGIKKRIGGINLFFTLEIYHSLVRKCDVKYWDDMVCEEAAKKEVKLISLLPSVIQHIGVFGINCHPDYTDVAHDFI